MGGGGIAWSQTLRVEFGAGSGGGDLALPRPRVWIERQDTTLILRVQLKHAGSFSLYQSDRPDRILQSGRLLCSGPARPARALIAETIVDLARPAFFRLVENSQPVWSNLVWIPPGSFLMGSPDDEVGRYPDEGPQHPVTIPRGFWLGKYEVTQAEFQEVIGYNPSHYSGRPDHPVEMVRWESATNFCARLTERERRAGRLPPGCVFRLPTEAEWEYACRADTTTRYSFGDDPDYALLGRHGWLSANSNAQTHAVGTLRPNPWGLYDMHGNVFEWCHDVFAPYPGGENIPGVPKPTGAHVFRGGSWICPPEVLRSASRHGIPPDLAPYIGFRVALGVPVP